VKRNYLSYLLRVWQTGEPESPAWVASLEKPLSHQIIHFNSLAALFQYLQQTTQDLKQDKAQDNISKRKRITGGRS
jgi:hypothetical protein